MIPKMNQPNIGADTIRIHRVITRGLNVAIERSQAYAQDGFPDEITRTGFVCYAGSLASVLDAHHLTEDELVFPYLQSKLPGAPYDLLIAQHHDMEQLLEEVKTQVEAVAAGEQPGAALAALNQALRSVGDIWHPHIQVEEEHFNVDALAALIEVEEHVRLGQMFGKHGMEHMAPDYLVVPFVLYNLSTEDRAIMSQVMPPVVIQQLVPIEWKERWAPMLPFLLP
jgi:hypothetical protein